MDDEIFDHLLDMGLQLIPIKPGGKEPIMPDWQRRQLDRDTLASVFSANKDLNAGILLGSASGGALDVDIDATSAIEIARQILRPTDCIFGRASKPASHYMYRCLPGEHCKGSKFIHPDRQVMIIELRGEGEQTVCAGSTYQNGELIQFATGKDGRPTEISIEHLRRQVGFVAATVLLSEDWVKGTRHFKALAFAGACAANAIPREVCLQIVDVIVDVANDEEGEDRRRAVEDTYRRHKNGQNVDGMETLRRILGEGIAKRFYEWMGMKQKKKAKEKGRTNQIKQQIATTDLEFTRDFARSVHGLLMYSDNNKTFYERRHGVYTPTSKTEARGHIHRYLDRRCATSSCDDETGSIKKMMYTPRMTAILEEAQTELLVSSSDFDRNPKLAGCQNGVLDIEKGMLIETDEYITRRLGVKFDQNAKCIRFEQFLKTIFAGDSEKIDFVQRSSGYILSGLIDEHCMFIFVGEGSNGKSTFQNVLYKIMGEYASAASMQTLVKDRFGSLKTDDIAALDGCRYVFAQEAEANQSFAEAKIKRMTGGDPMAVRALYNTQYTTKPTYKLCLFTNRIPKIDATDNAIWRRLHIIPFPVTIPAEDRIAGLDGILASEGSGILNWMIKGFQEFTRLGGLCPPQSIVDLRNEFRTGNDTVEQFVVTCCDTTDRGASTSVKLLYDTYVVWCSNSGIDPIVTSEFGKSLQRLGFEVKRRNTGNHRLGIKLFSNIDD